MKKLKIKKTYERKNRIANKLQMDFKNVDPNGGNVEERNSKSMQFFFLKSC
jgi:hypothetical protein